MSKQYAIVKKLDYAGDLEWVAYRYNWWFKIYGPSSVTSVLFTGSCQSADKCKTRLMKVLSADSKAYEIIEIVDAPIKISGIPSKP